jgi:hypothetical protein
MLPQLSQQLLAKWSDLPLDRKRPDQLTFLGIRTGVAEGYTLFLAFADRDPGPCLAVKVPREPATESRLQHEWDMLNHFQRQGPHWSGASLPRPLLWDVVNGVHILVTTAPPGRPLGPGIGSPAEQFARVEDWLVQLACATRTTQPIAAVRRDLGRTAERLSTTLELSDREVAVLEDWISGWEKMSGDGQADLFAAHGDLRSRNIWLQRGHLTVINWEQGRLACLPLQDMFTFITTYRFPARRRRPKEDYLQVFRATYLADGPYADLVCRTIASYGRALDIPLESLEASFGFFLAYAALREYDQLLAAADRGYLPLLRDPDCSARRPYRQAIRDQLWINLLRLLIEERGRFKPGIHPSSRGRYYAISVQQSVPTRRQKVLG